MALFKIFRGQESDLNSVPCHEGYAYFTEDTCRLFIDIGNGVGDRMQVNAYAADVIKTADGEIDVDDILLKKNIVGVASGGTGLGSVPLNALLVGGGSHTEPDPDHPGETITVQDPLKLVMLDPGDLLIGDSTNGAKGLKGTGVLYALTSGAPQFGVAPVAAGGTGRNAVTSGALLYGNGTSQMNELSGVGALYALTANSPEFGTLPLRVGGTGATGATDAQAAQNARDNLSVYSKDEIDTKVSDLEAKAGKGVSASWAWTIEANGWVAVNDGYQYSYTNTKLTCGSDGKIPPIVTCTENQEEFSNIDSAEATPHSDTETGGIVFKATIKPINDIKVVIIDVR